MPRKSKIEKCDKCTKSVYANEKLEAMGKVFHNTCFRCFKCDKRLTMITYCEGPDKNPHCQTCYNSNFGPKGYGFGDTAVGEFEEHGKAENTGLKARSEVFSGSTTTSTSTAAAAAAEKSSSPKPAWQVKQERKIAKSKQKKEQRKAASATDETGQEQVPAKEEDGNDDEEEQEAESPRSNAGSGEGGSGGGGSSSSSGKSSKTGSSTKKYASWATKGKRKTKGMKISKRAIPKCAQCNKSVYANEKIQAMGKDFHTTCFHCIECKKRVTPITFCEGGDDQLYCKPCYNKFFAPRGHGFGGAVN